MFLCVFTHAHVYVCMYVCVCACAHVCLFVCVHACDVCLCVCVVDISFGSLIFAGSFIAGVVGVALIQLIRNR